MRDDMWLDNDMTTTEIHSTARQHLAQQSTSDLVAMLKLTSDKAIEIWIIEALETRIDGLTATLNEWADSESELSQKEVVLAVAK